MSLALASIVFGLFVVDRPVPPVNPHETRSIKDRAEMFSVQTIARAQARIDDARNKDGDTLDMAVEAVAELPDLPSATLRKMGNRESRAKLRAIALHLADEAKCRGLFVLIVNEPRHVTVVGWPTQKELDVSSVKRENLRKYLARELSTDPDRALLGACDHFRDIVRSLEAVPPAPLQPHIALVLIGGLSVAWLLLCFLRSRVVSPAPPIYQPAMLGSIFGVPSGYWIYDRLFQAERPLVLLPPDQVEPLAPIPAVADPAPEPDPASVGDSI